MYVAYNMPRVKFAELIMYQNIKEYSPGTAYVILKNRDRHNDELELLRLGECVLYGIGTDKNPIVASELLSSAYQYLECVISDYDEYYTNEFYGEDDYRKAYEEAINLYEQAESEASKLSDHERMAQYDSVLDDIIFFIIIRWKRYIDQFAIKIIICMYPASTINMYAHNTPIQDAIVSLG